MDDRADNESAIEPAAKPRRLSGLFTTLLRFPHGPRLRWVAGRNEKWLMVPVGLAILAWLSAHAAWLGNSLFWRFIGQVCVVLAPVGAFVYQLLTIPSALCEMIFPLPGIMKHLGRRSRHEMAAISTLSKRYSKHQLEYASARIALQVSHRTQRIGFVVGAFDKLGVMPAAVTGYFVWEKLQREGAHPANLLHFAFVLLIALHVLTMIHMFALQKLQRLGLFTQLAGTRKSGRTA